MIWTTSQRQEVQKYFSEKAFNDTRKGLHY